MEVVVTLELDTQHILSAEEIEQDLRLNEHNIGWDYDYKIKEVTIPDYEKRVSLCDHCKWCDKDSPHPCEKDPDEACVEVLMCFDFEHKTGDKK